MVCRLRELTVGPRRGRWGTNKPAFKLPTDSHLATSCLAFSPDGTRLAAGSGWGGPLIWNIPEIYAQLVKLGLQVVGGLTLDKGNVRPGKTTFRKHNQGLDIAVLTTLRWQGESDAIKRLKKTIHVPMRYPKESQMYARPDLKNRVSS